MCFCLLTMRPICVKGVVHHGVHHVAHSTVAQNVQTTHWLQRLPLFIYLFIYFVCVCVCVRVLKLT